MLKVALTLDADPSSRLLVDETGAGAGGNAADAVAWGDATGDSALTAFDGDAGAGARAAGASAAGSETVGAGTNSGASECEGRVGLASGLSVGEGASHAFIGEAT